MPLYEYTCDRCARVTEALQRVSDPPLESCPHCGGVLRKLLSAPAVQFKGQGWYVTDYARKGGAARSEAGKAAPAGSEPGGAKEDAGGSTPPAPAPKPGSGSGPASGD